MKKYPNAAMAASFAEAYRGILRDGHWDGEKWTPLDPKLRPKYEALLKVAEAEGTT